MDAIKFTPGGKCQGKVTPPGSKSITNRALVCAAMACGESRLRGMLESEDTEVMVRAWESVGCEISWDRPLRELVIVGCGGVLPNQTRELFIENSGTTIRFLTAALAALPAGDFTLDGIARMRERPIGDLIDALNQIGGDVKSINRDSPACPPVRIRASGLNGGTCQVAGNISSQYLSGLMMAAPYATSDTDITITGDLVSLPYVEITRKVMSAFSIEARPDPSKGLPKRFTIPGQRTYQSADYLIEPDASAASYYFAAAAITGGKVQVDGLKKNALQGDVEFCGVLEKMGCEIDYLDDSIVVHGNELRGIDIDMNHISDTVQTLAAVALFAKGSTRVRNVAHNRHKETDRIADLARELRKVGATVQEFDDGLEITPPKRINSAEIETYNDHRMAMSLSLIGLKIDDIWIRNPGCTAKTYPTFFEEFAMTFSLKTEVR